MTYVVFDFKNQSLVDDAYQRHIEAVTLLILWCKLQKEFN